MFPFTLTLQRQQDALMRMSGAHSPEELLLFDNFALFIQVRDSNQQNLANKRFSDCEIPNLS